MSSLFFAKTFCVFIFVVCAFCEAAHAENGADETVRKINIFNSGLIDKIIPPDGNEAQANGNIEIESFYSPVLLSTDDVLIAVAGANSNKNSKNQIDILTNYTVTTENDEWVNKAFPTDGTAQNWKTQFALKEDNQKKDVVKNLAATARGNKIYILLVDQSTTLSDKEWVFSVVEGTLTKEETSVGAVVKTTKIAWQKSQLSDLSIDGKFKRDVSDSNLQFLSAFVTTDDTAVFFVKGETQESGKNVFAIIKTKNSKKVSEVLSIAGGDDACNPNFFLWGEKIIMLPTSCKESTGQQIKQFDLKNEEFKESKEFNNRVWDFLKDKKDITTATINTTPVVLFTQEKGNGEKDIHLWITDGNRSANVGIVFDKVKDGFYRSFVCTNNKLFSLHKNKDENVYKATYFSTETKKIINVLKDWNEGNQRVSELCKKTDTVKISCSTDGLVGFLSNKSVGNTEWIDEYQCVKARVTESKKVDNGFQFNKPRAGVKWLLKKEKEDQPYDFRNPGFTLVATVTIGSSTNSEKNSILGFSLADDANDYVSLWCTKDGQWGLSSGNEQTSKESTTKCEQGETYIIALVMNGENLSIYVDGKELTGFDDETKQIKKSEAIAYFYFGANDAKELLANTDVTVANVMLYNRPLEKEKEISELKAKKINEDIRQNTGGNDNNLQQQDVSTTESGESFDTPPTKENETKDKHSSPPPPTTEDSAARVGVVRVLCFMLFGVFTLLGRYVY